MANTSKTKKSQDFFTVEGRGAKKVYLPSGGSPFEANYRSRDGRVSTVQYVPYSNDDWRKRIARGEGVTSLLIGDRLSFIGKMASAQIRVYNGNQLQVGYTYACDQPMGGSIIMPNNSGAADSGRASALAGEKLVADYYEKRSSVNGGAIMAEAIETVRGLASPTKALRKEVTSLYQSLGRRLYRSNGQQVRDAAKVIGGTWLEWKFAVDPLIQDCDDAATAINKMSSGDFKHTIPIRGVGVDELYLYQGTQPVAVSGIPTAMVTNCVRIDKCIVINRAAIRVTPGNGAEVPLAMQFGVGVEDIAPSVLEAIPWSWFVDYFVNVSSVIQAWSIIGGNILWSNRTVRNSRSQIWGPANAVPNTSGPNRSEYSIIRPGYAVAEFKNVSRAPANWADLMPPMRVRVPHTGVKWANLAALSTMYSNLKNRALWTSPGLTRRARGNRSGALGNWEYVTKPPRKR
jgi:hypothetical protein